MCVRQGLNPDQSLQNLIWQASQVAQSNSWLLWSRANTGSMIANSSVDSEGKQATVVPSGRLCWRPIGSDQRR